MKKISDYFKDKDLKIEYLDEYVVEISRELLLEIIKEIQIDTIKETVQACANNADTDVHFNGWLAYVIKSSILEVADKLIGELE